MPSLEEQIVTGSNLDAYPANQNGLPGRDQFVSFLAKRFLAELGDELTEVAIHVSRIAKHEFKVSGSAKVGNLPKPVQGSILWLPKPKCFRGHLIVDAEARVNEMLVAEANAVRVQNWRKRVWEGDDHDHCTLCWAKISSKPVGADYDFGYTAESLEWLCPKCYQEVVLDGAGHPFLESG